MTVSYATLRDVYDLGLSARAFVVVPRPLDARAGDSLDFATGTFWQSGHGIADTDLVWLVLIARGGTNAIPGGAAETTTYHGLPVDHRRFRLSLSEGGAAVTFSDAGTVAANGSSAWGVYVSPERRLEVMIREESAQLDQVLIAHRTPLEPDPVTGRFPEAVTGIVSRAVARRAIAGMMFDNAASKVPSERLDAMAEADKATRAKWASGVPIYPAPVDQTTLADNGGQSTSRLAGIASCSRPLNWVRGTL